MDKVHIKINPHGGQLPEKLVQGDWIDLRAAERVEMKAGEYRVISLGVSMVLPGGFEAHVAPRSSTFAKWGILMVNGIGIIDNSYSGDNDIWGFPALAMRDKAARDPVYPRGIPGRKEPRRLWQHGHTLSHGATWI